MIQKIKLKFILILVLLAGQVFAQHTAYPDKPSTHGMMLMGNETIYASHLPMFHSPHDYQIILELEIQAKDKKKYLEDRKAHPNEQIYTLEPEQFVLPEMVNHTKQFKASIYRGHFERGGTKFLQDIQVKIQKVIYYKQFKKEDVKVPKLQYMLFGNKKEQFLAKKIAARPDFDEHVIVHIADKSILNTITKKGCITIEFDEPDQVKPLSWKKKSGFYAEGNKMVYFDNHKVLYLEFGDLK